MRDITKTENDTIPRLIFSGMNHEDFQNFYAKTNTFPDEFINSLINDSDLFNQFLSILKDSSDFRFGINFPNISSISISKFAVIDTLREKNHPNQDLIDEIVSPATMIGEFKNKKYSTTINDRTIDIDISEILNALLYNSHITSVSLSSTDEIKLLQEFLFNYPIDYKYDLPTDCLTKIEALQSIDPEAMDKINETKDLRRGDIQLNSELIESVTSTIPDHFDATEKAIYIYIKLCDMLAYDPSYITNHEQMQEIQSDISYIEQITSTYNQIVCYNFTSIFGKFLSMLDLNYEILVLRKLGDKKEMVVESDFVKQSQQQETTEKPKKLKDKILGLFNRNPSKSVVQEEQAKSVKSPNFSPAHSALRFKSDNFIISADAAKNLYQNDLTNVKINQNLSGLNCITNNRETKLAFDTKIIKVYDYYKQQKEKEKREMKEKKASYSFEEALNTYTELFFQNTPLTFEKKKEILLSSLKNCDLPPTESIGYLLHLHHTIMFKVNNPDYEQLGIKLYKQENVNSQSSLVAAIIFHGEDEQANDTQIHLYRPPNKIEQITTQKYKDMVDSQELTDLGISGFDINSKPKKGKV
jgi:hypothetical protein